MTIKLSSPRRLALAITLTGFTWTSAAAGQAANPPAAPSAAEASPTAPPASAVTPQPAPEPTAAPKAAAPVATAPILDAPSASPSTPPPAGPSTVHGIGFSGVLGGALGFTYRRYFGDSAIDVGVAPAITNRGDNVDVIGGVNFTRYLVRWENTNPYSWRPSAALRLSAGASWIYQSSSDMVSVNVDSTCKDTTSTKCDKTQSKQSFVDQDIDVGVQLGWEFGRIAEPGLSVAVGVSGYATFRYSTTPRDEFGSKDFSKMPVAGEWFWEKFDWMPYGSVMFSW